MFLGSDRVELSRARRDKYSMLCRECQEFISKFYSLIDRCDETGDAIDLLPEREDGEKWTPEEDKAYEADLEALMSLAYFVLLNRERIGILHAEPEPAVKQVLH